MKHLTRLIAALLVLVMTLAAVPVIAETDTTAEPADDQSLCRIALPKKPDLLDGNECSTATMVFIYEVFDTLTKLQPDGTLAPCLATEWNQVDDLTWQFKLREGVVYSDGSPFNADCVVETLTYLATKDPAFKYKAKWASSWPITVEKVDDYTVNIHTQTPSFECPALLSRNGIWPVGATSHYEDFVKSPVGTGAYKVESYSLAENITLVRNDLYWGEPAKIERLSYDIITDQSAMSIALAAGTYDAYLGITYDDAQDMEKNPGKYDTVLFNQESLGMQYLFFNGRSKNPFIQDVNFRKAMTYAIDHAGILEYLLYNYVEPGRGVTAVTAGIQNVYVSEGYPAYDPAKAQELAKACGYNGEEIKLFYVSGQFTNDLEITELIVSELIDAGFNINMQEVEASTWSSTRPTDTYDIALNSCSGSFTGQPTDYITQVLGKSAGWTWDHVDELINKAYSAGTTEEEFGQLIQQACKEAWEEMPYLWATERIYQYALNPKLVGLETLATGYVRMSNAYFAK